jgi:hypothetical protein
VLAFVLGVLTAIVVEDGTALRATAAAGSARQVELSRGDWLEVRGERTGVLQVYDHRRERSGYVRAWQVRTYTLDATAAPALRAIVGFLREQPGGESLGIGYVALYLRAAPANAVGTDVLDALGVVAERLVRRASLRRGTGGVGGGAVAAHLQVAEGYGLRFESVERTGRTMVCYDGDAFRRVLAASEAPVERATAAIALTRRDCVAAANPIRVREWNAWRGKVLAQVDPARVPAHLGARLRLRRAEVAAWVSHDLQGRGEATAAAAAAAEAVEQLALVDRAQLGEDDTGAYAEAAVRVAASRWATEPPAKPRPGAPTIELTKGEPGQTCLVLRRGKAAPLAERCTYGVVWQSSLRLSPRGDAIAIAVQPLPAWTELWLFHQTKDGWTIDTIPPAATEPDTGYAELAGFSADGAHLAIVREHLTEGRHDRTFELRRTDTLTIKTSTHTPTRLFRRHATPDWQTRTLALR